MKAAILILGPFCMALFLLDAYHLKKLNESRAMESSIRTSYVALLNQQQEQSTDLETITNAIISEWRGKLLKFRDDRQKIQDEYEGNITQIRDQKDALYEQREALYTARIKELESELHQSWAMQRPPAQVSEPSPDYSRQLSELTHQLWLNNETMIQWKEQQQNNFMLSR